MLSIFFFAGLIAVRASFLAVMNSFFTLVQFHHPSPSNVLFMLCCYIIWCRKNVFLTQKAYNIKNELLSLQAS